MSYQIKFFRLFYFLISIVFILSANAQQSTAERVIVKSGDRWKVSIEITPSAETSSYAVEEMVAEGWGVDKVNEDGFFDSRNSKLKWGPWLGGTARKARTLEYELTAPAGFTGELTLSGVASFDGPKVQIKGANQIKVQEDKPQLMITNFNKVSSIFSLTIKTNIDSFYELEASEDLNKWTKIKEVKGTGENIIVTDSRQIIFEKQYYRIRIK